MKKIQCEVCGSDSIKKTSNNEFVCENCGIKYSDKTISNLLVDDVKKDSTKDNQNIQDMKNNMFRYMKTGELKRVCDTANKIMSVDSENPEAILLYGVASTKLKASNVGSLFTHTIDAIKYKRKQTTNEKEFYDFLNSALKLTYDVYQSCYNLVAKTYQNSYDSYNQKSIQENIRYNEEQFRRAVSKGETYYGRNVESPTIIDTIGNSWLASMDANRLKNEIFESAIPNMLKLVDCLEEYNLNMLNEEGIAIYIDCLTAKFNMLRIDIRQGAAINIKYNDVEKRIEFFEKYIELLNSFAERSNNYNTINSIKKLTKISNKHLKKLNKLKNDKTFGIAISYSNLFFLLIPIYGWFVALACCIATCGRMARLAKSCEVPESVFKAAKKKMFILTSIFSLPTVALLIWLAIELSYLYL